MKYYILLLLLAVTLENVFSLAAPQFKNKETGESDVKPLDYRRTVRGDNLAQPGVFQNTPGQRKDQANNAGLLAERRLSSTNNRDGLNKIREMQRNGNNNNKGDNKNINRKPTLKEQREFIKAGNFLTSTKDEPRQMIIDDPIIVAKEMEEEKKSEVQNVNRKPTRAEFEKFMKERKINPMKDEPRQMIIDDPIIVAKEMEEEKKSEVQNINRKPTRTDIEKFMKEGKREVNPMKDGPVLKIIEDDKYSMRQAQEEKKDDARTINTKSSEDMLRNVKKEENFKSTNDKTRQGIIEDMLSNKQIQDIKKDKILTKSTTFEKIKNEVTFKSIKDEPRQTIIDGNVNF